MQYINEEKLNQIKLNNNFYVATDFDKTLTATDSTSSWGACEYVFGTEYLKRTNELMEKYAPLELDYNITVSEKEKVMEEWSWASLDLIYEYNLTSDLLKKGVEKSNLIFRDGAKEFLELMNEKNIPVIIMSAGLGNVIEMFLKKNNCYYDNIFIISNFIEFDENGNMKKFQNNMIHTLNKTINGHLNSEILNKISDKKYRLLFGDFIEDKNIVPKEEWDDTISVGFLCSEIEKNLNVYKENFDIVLTEEDSSFNIVRKMLNIY